MSREHGIPYYVVREGKRGPMGYWQPSTTLRKLGHKAFPCGQDSKEARAKAVAYSLSIQSSRVTYSEEDEIPDAVSEKLISEGSVYFSDTQAENIEGYVYFLEAGGLVKIGFSKHPTKRVNDIRTSLGFKIDAVLIVRGTMKDERKMHRILGDHRAEGEWFNMTAEVRNVIVDIARSGTTKQEQKLESRRPEYELQSENGERDGT